MYILSIGPSHGDLRAAAAAAIVATLAAAAGSYVAWRVPFMLLLLLLKGLCDLWHYELVPARER